MITRAESTPAASPRPTEKAIEAVVQAAVGRRVADKPGTNTAPAGRRVEERVRESTIRVDTVRLDQVLNLSGEIGLTKNRLTSLRADILAGRTDTETVQALDQAVSQLDLLVSDLQNSVMKTRMQPIGRLFQKYLRIARDLARQLCTSPTVSLTAAVTFDLGGVGDPIIPAGLLNVGSRVRFFARLRKVGATATVLRMYFGTDLTTRTNNSQIWAQTAATTTDLDIPPETLLTFISETTARSSNRATRGGSGVQGTVTYATTLLQIACAMKATIEASTLASDTVHLLSFGIVWEA